jgi:hypothetical protein
VAQNRGLHGHTSPLRSMPHHSDVTARTRNLLQHSTVIFVEKLQNVHRACLTSRSHDLGRYGAPLELAREPLDHLQILAGHGDLDAPRKLVLSVKRVRRQVLAQRPGCDCCRLSFVPGSRDLTPFPNSGKQPHGRGFARFVLPGTCSVSTF